MIGFIRDIYDRYQERKLIRNLEGALRTGSLMAHIEAEVPRLEPRQRRAFPDPPRTPDKPELEARRRKRKDGYELAERIAQSVRKGAVEPAKRFIDALENRRDHFRNAIFQQYVRNPEHTIKTANSYLDRIEERLRKRPVNEPIIASLERRIRYLEAKISGYGTNMHAADISENPSYKGSRASYDRRLAPDGMNKEIIKAYATDYSRSLKKIAKDIGAKYGMKVSESTMRRIARKELGDVSRRDRSAEKAYNGKGESYARKQGGRYKR